MERLFAYNYAGPPFVLGSAQHIAAILALLALNLVLLRLRGETESLRRCVRTALAIIVWVDEALWHLWNAYHDAWAANFMLPLQLCSMLIWLSGVALLTRNRTLHEFIYLLGVPAAFQYLLTPDLGTYGFPHFRYFQTYISHGLLLTTGLYLTFVEGMRPTWRSVLRVAIGINLVMLFMYPLNRLLGSNYLLINYKPASASILDLFPPWPAYILYMEAIGLLSVLLLMIPFARPARSVPS